jgi:hypothetical protein
MTVVVMGVQFGGRGVHVMMGGDSGGGDGETGVQFGDSGGNGWWW